MSRVNQKRSEYLAKFLPLSPEEQQIILEGETAITEAVAKAIWLLGHKYQGRNITKLMSISTSLVLVAQAEGQKIAEEEKG